jgi:hypothetical protein
MKHAQSICGIRKEDIRLITQVLSIDDTDQEGKPMKKNEQIIAAIKKLPSALRICKLQLMVRRPATALCSSHKRLNPDVIHRLYELVKSEVTSRMTPLYWYHGVLHAKLRNQVHSLKDMQLMWTPSRRTIFRGPVTYQRNKCKACILARIVREPDFLLHLRAAILSRTPTGRRHRVPRLLPFIEESMACHGALIEQIHYLSGMWAKTMKHQREYALWALRSSNPVARLEEDRHDAKMATVPIGIDIKTLEASQHDGRTNDFHGKAESTSERRTKRKASDADTLAGIIKMYSDRPWSDWTSSPTYCRTEPQSSFFSDTYSGYSVAHTPDPLHVYPLSIIKKGPQGMYGSEERAAIYQKGIGLPYSDSENGDLSSGSDYGDNPPKKFESTATHLSLFM